jgi:formylglycine-generating enzyme required for sulfatase activity
MSTIYFLFIGTQFKLYKLKQRTLNNFIFVKGGEFMMGDFDLEIQTASGTLEQRNTKIYPDTRPAHLVRLDSYYMQKFETTNTDFDLFSKVNNRKLRQKTNMKLRKSEYPAEIFWNQANDYCHWLGDILDLPIVLPSEAQWEFAARSRGYNVGYATNWGTVNPKVNINILTHEEQSDVNLGSAYPPNPLGFYEMSGNLAEWVNDWYDAEYYKHSPVENPKGPKNGDMHISRGGSVLQSINWRITTLRTAVPLSQPLSLEDRKGSRIEQNFPAYSRTEIGVRCALNRSVPPNKSGFGVMAGEIPENFPKRLSWVPLHGNNTN